MSDKQLTIIGSFDYELVANEIILWFCKNHSRFYDWEINFVAVIIGDQ